MKKTVFVLVALVGLLLLLPFLKNCSPGEKETVNLTKVDVKGDWQPSKVEPIDSTERTATTNNLQRERDLYFEKYKSYQALADAFYRQMQSLDMEVDTTKDCSEQLSVRERQVAALVARAARDSALIEALFVDFDSKGQQRDYFGEVSGANFTTQWRAKVFGELPTDGINIKTDVFFDSVTVVKYADNWKKNSIDAFGGIDQNANYLFGIGYERQFAKWAGLYWQLEYLPKPKDGAAKAGVRVHF